MLKFLFLILIIENVIAYNTTNSNLDEGDWDNATWVLNSAFVIITMQSGFGLLESGTVSSKNSVNIMMKNLCDVIFGGFIYWVIGYGLSFGDDYGTNGFSGLGKFFFDSNTDSNGGWEYSRYFLSADKL